MAIVNDVLKFSNFVWGQFWVCAGKKNIAQNIFVRNVRMIPKWNILFLLLNKSPAVCRKSPEITKGLPG